jgi:hypothetical protein
MRKLHSVSKVLLLGVTGLGIYVGCGGGDDSATSGSTSDAGTTDAAPTATGTTTGTATSTATATATATADAGPRVCTGTQTLCSDGNCADLQLDRNNCGTCGKKCADSEVCSGGTCGLTCGGGSTKCGNNCVELNVDPKNCGTCGNVCGAGQTCGPNVGGDAGADAGTAAFACQCAAPLTAVGTACVDTSSDDKNCGKGGNICGAGKECSGGVCKGAISAWFFEGDFTDSTATNNGAAEGNPQFDPISWSVGAKQSLKLDGASAVAIAAPASLPINQDPRTIEAWVRATVFGDTTYSGILSYGVRGCTTGQVLSLTNNFRASSANWCNDLIESSSASIAATAWSHVAYTWDGTTRKLYVDGILVTADMPVAFATTIDQLRIGETDLGGRHFVGNIDDVKIYDYARSAAQLSKTVNQDVAYAFTAATDTTDSGPNQTSFGTKSGNVTAGADRKGNANSAIVFDGDVNTSFQAYPVSVLGKSRPYTISIWIKATAAAAGTIAQVSQNQNGAGWCLPMLGLDANGNPVAQSWTGAASTAASADPVTAGTWTHIAQTWSPTGGLRLYVNGVLKATNPQATFAPSNAPDYVTLGSQGAGGGACTGALNAAFAGSVDDFKVWGRELSATEIAAEAK